MGRIAQSAEVTPDSNETWSNAVDLVLEGLDDDEDRAVVLSWLRNTDAWSSSKLQFKLHAYGFVCSDKSIQRWRRAQADGIGRVWE